MTCFCGEGAIGLIGEDGIPMCLVHYCEELEDLQATIDIATAAVGLAELRTQVRWHYEPANCRWATPYEQRHNRRIA